MTIQLQLAVAENAPVQQNLNEALEKCPGVYAFEAKTLDGDAPDMMPDPPVRKRTRKAKAEKPSEPRKKRKYTRRAKKDETSFQPSGTTTRRNLEDGTTVETRK